MRNCREAEALNPSLSVSLKNGANQRWVAVDIGYADEVDA